MSTSKPIKEKAELKEFMEYYHKIKKSDRNYLLILTGLYTGLRVSDLINLKWSDVYDKRTRNVKSHITIIEGKTKKIKVVSVNKNLDAAIKSYYKTTKPKRDEYLFFSLSDPRRPISRVQAYRIVKEAANACIKDPKNISTHSLRKTFGYYAFKGGASPVLLMEIFNHSSYEITRRYIGVDQDEKDEIYMMIDY